MTLKKLLSYTRRAVDDYHLIESGDKIAVGISGGKDSLTLLYALKNLQRFYEKPFELIAVTVDLGYDNFDLTPIKKLCEELEIPYYIIPTEIGKIVQQDKNKTSPCSLCAKLRKGAFNEAILSLSCNTVAYAHHQDDVIETMFLSLIYEGRFYSFSPKTYLEHTGLKVIRPLIYVPEAEIKGFQNKYRLPVVKNPCPVDGTTKRQYVKDLIRQMNLDNPGVKTRLFHAITNAELSDWNITGK